MTLSFKKHVAIILACLILFSFIFVGCQENNNNQNNSNKAQNSNNDNNNEDSKNTDNNNSKESEKKYPLTGNKTLTYWVELNDQLSQSVSNLAESEYGKQLLKNTGVTIEFQHPAANQAEEAFNLLVASGDYPDIVEYNILNNYPGGPEKAILDGFIISLNDKIEAFAPNLYRYYKENPTVEKMAKTDSGKYYSFPFIRGADNLRVFFGPIVRKDWLDDLGLDDPETIDDWYNMLTAFKNEKGAIAPLTYQSWMFSNGNGSPFLGAYGVAKDFYLNESGNILFGQIQPGYRDFLEEFSKWYEEGLIDADLLTVDANQVAAKITSGDSGASLGYQASRLGNWLASMKDDPNYNLLGAKNPVLEKGEKPMFSQKDLPIPGSNTAYITTGCKDVETAMLLLDYNYSEEGHMLNNFGIEGVSYEMIDGYPTYTDFIMKNEEYSPAVISRLYIRASYGGPFVQDERYMEQYGYTYPQQKIANENWAYSDIDKYKLPPITPTPEESQEVSTIMGEINTYTEEMFSKYLMGQESLDSFDTYVNNIKKMGIDRVIEIKEGALKRYNNR